MVKVIRPVLSSSNLEKWEADHLRAPLGHVIILVSIVQEVSTVGAKVPHGYR
jgi:hypothetical protein